MNRSQERHVRFLRRKDSWDIVGNRALFHSMLYINDFPVPLPYRKQSHHRVQIDLCLLDRNTVHRQIPVRQFASCSILKEREAIQTYVPANVMKLTALKV